LVLLGADPTLSAALRLAELDQTLSLAPDWKAATDLLRAQPRRLARESLMPATIDASTLARAAIREVCREWDLDAVSMEAEMTATELVANAANHAGTESTLACTLAGEDLQIAVQDKPIFYRRLADRFNLMGLTVAEPRTPVPGSFSDH
jgi:hypothetical protein